MRVSLSFSPDLDPIWFTDAVLGLFSADSRVINNDFERQPRIRRGQIDTIDQAMEKWLRRSTTRADFLSVPIRDFSRDAIGDGDGDGDGKTGSSIPEIDTVF